jgi:hypothetical protein
MQYDETPVPEGAFLTRQQAQADDTVDIDEIDVAAFMRAEDARCEAADPLDDGGPDHLQED